VPATPGARPGFAILKAMADQLYLSLWLRESSPLQMLPQFQKLLQKFPFSQLRPGISLLRIHALSYSEPPLLEQGFTSMPELEEVLEIATYHSHPDCCYEVEAWWDIFQLDEESWKLTPVRVLLQCFGPEFENPVGDHLRVEFGLETWFVPELEHPGSQRATQANVKGLLRLVHDLDNTLRLTDRKLWLESGENLAVRLQELSSQE
jgi:hypothetical protein